jgi:hypothetical protein
MKKILAVFSDAEYAKVKKQKQTDGYGKTDWAKWMMSKTHQSLIDSEVDAVSRGTKQLRKIWHMNIGHNMAYIRRADVKNLRELAETETKGSALVVAGGPSIAIHNHLDVLKDSGYKGTIVACDRMLKPLLEKGIVPDYVLTVDASDIILEFYKTKLFRENRKNIRVLLHYTTSPKVVRYLYRLKAEVYWFIVHTEFTIQDDSDVLGPVYMSMTKHNPEGLQTIVAGGNVGVAAWAFSWVVLKKNPVMLIGMDMGYPEGTDLRKTYYYSSMMNTVSKFIKDSTLATLALCPTFEKEFNPVWKSYTYTDTVFRGYRAMLNTYLDHTPENQITINCTEGGALHHPKLRYGKLAEMLKKFGV